MVIVGGCGHVGLPLALSLADCGYTVGIDDIDAAKVELVKGGNAPFEETGAEALLRKILPTGRLQLASNPAMIGRTSTVILVMSGFGTPHVWRGRVGATATVWTDVSGAAGTTRLPDIPVNALAIAPGSLGSVGRPGLGSSAPTSRMPSQ